MHVADLQTNEPSIFLTVSKDGGVLLDLKHDRLLKLNTSGVLMWTLLSQGLSAEEVAARLAQQYQVGEAQVREHLQTLLRSAATLGLDPRAGVTITEQVTDRAGAKPDRRESFPWYGQNANDKRAKPRTLLVVKAFLGLLLFDATLSIQSFEALCRRMRQWPVQQGKGDVKRECVGEVCSAVERACVWYPKKALCLQRSAVTACLLRSEGVDARMVVGIRPMPLVAHAWVEAGGKVVNDWPRVRKFYSAMAAY
jgi:hypothetical protein